MRIEKDNKGIYTVTLLESEARLLKHILYRFTYPYKDTPEGYLTLTPEEQIVAKQYWAKTWKSDNYKDW